MKITLFGLPRTGSTYLYNCVVRFLFKRSFAQQNNFWNLKLNEYLNPDYNHSVEKYLHILDTNRDWVNKELIVNNISDKIFNYHNDNSDKIFLILRKNWLEQVSSGCLASITNQWLKLNKNKNSDPTHVPTDLFYNKFNHFWDSLNKSVQKINYTNIIFYEDLEFWPRKDLQHLNLIEKIEDIHRISVPINKQDPKSKTILNFEELINYFNTMDLTRYTSQHFYFDSNKHLKIKND